MTSSTDSRFKKKLLKIFNEGYYKMSKDTDVKTSANVGGDARLPFKSETSRSIILKEADKIINTDRAVDYSPPENSFQHISLLWNAYLEAKGFTNVTLNGIDVALMMDLLKTARLASNPMHNDSWIDKAGYAACGGGIAMDIKKQAQSIAKTVMSHNIEDLSPNITGRASKSVENMYLDSLFEIPTSDAITLLLTDRLEDGSKANILIEDIRGDSLLRNLPRFLRSKGYFTYSVEHASKNFANIKGLRVLGFITSSIYKI